MPPSPEPAVRDTRSESNATSPPTINSNPHPSPRAKPQPPPRPVQVHPEVHQTMHNPAPTAQTLQQPVINPQPVMNPQPLMPSAFTPQPQPQQSLALYQVRFSYLLYILY